MMMIRMIAAINIIIILLANPVLARQQLTVQSITSEYVHINGGTESGLQRGEMFKVYHSERLIAVIKVEFISRLSAACIVMEQTRPITTGDKLQPCPECQQDNTSVDKGKSKTRVDGYLVAQYYQFDDQSQYNNDFQQPAVRLQFKVKNLWNKDYHFKLKLRTRYSERKRRYSSDNNSKWRNRLYQVAFSYDNPNAGLNYQVGRIISNSFSGVGYIDGLLVQHNTGKYFKTGIFAGTQPQWQYSELQTDLQKYGALATYSKGDFATTKLDMSIALVGEYHSKITSREYLYLQNSFQYHKKVSVYQRLELDVNRGWRREKTDNSISMSSLYLSGDYRFSDAFNAGLSYNNFKNYYTYELLTIADSLFDDAFRHGLRSNFRFKLSQDVRIYMNAGIRKNQEQDDYTYSYASVLNYQNLLIKSLRLMARFSGFSNLYTRGINPSIKLGKYFRTGHSFTLGYGAYQYRYVRNDLYRQSQWVELDSHMELPGAIYFSAQYEYEWGDITNGQRIYLNLGYRF